MNAANGLNAAKGNMPQLDALIGSLAPFVKLALGLVLGYYIVTAIIAIVIFAFVVLVFIGIFFGGLRTKRRATPRIGGRRF